MKLTLSDFLSELKYDDFSNKISELSKEDPNLKEKFNQILNDYLNYLIDYLKDKPLEIVISTLDIFNNYNPKLSMALLNRKEESILRAALVIETLNGTDALTIKNDKEAAIAANQFVIYGSGIGFTKGLDVLTDFVKDRINILNEFIKDKDDSTIEEELNKDYNTLAKGLKNVDEIIFSLSTKTSFPPRSNYINGLFLNENVDSIYLNDIYNEVLLKNNVLKSFDYDKITSVDNDNIIKIKGLFRKCGSNYFKIFEEVGFGEEDKEELDEYFNDLIKLNTDDEEGLKWYFRELGKNTKDNDYLNNYLNNSEFYNKYHEDDSKLYEDTVNRLLNGDYNIDQNILNEVGASKEFLDNYEVFKERFFTSQDKECQNKLLIPLIRGLIEQQKERYDVKFNTIFTTNNISKTTLGYYNKENKDLYINPMYLDSFNDKKDAFAAAALTVFHETRHAYQHQVISKDNSLSYDNLVMAMDNILSENNFSSYYKDNYKHISYERDARDCAYVDAMTFFDKYKEAQKLLVPDDTSNFVLSDYIRKQNMFIVEGYSGIIQMFMDYVNDMIELSHGDEISANYFLDQYKVLGEFFEYNPDSGHIVPRSNEYFENRIKELESLPDNSIEKKEGLYSIKAFKYSMEVTNYLYKNNIDKEVKKDVYNEEVIKEVCENVGPRPSR